jgi:small conductance mechanosensitive channel
MVVEESLAFLRTFAGKIVLAAIVLLVGVIVGRIVERAVRFFLKQIGVNRGLSRIGLAFAFEESVSNVIKYAIFGLSFFLALDQLGLASYTFAVLGSLVMFVVVVAILLGIKDFLPNYWAGLWLYRKRFYRIGDTIEVNGIIGVVERFEVLETAVRTRTGDTIYLPSSMILHSQIIKKEKHHGQ